MSCISFMSFLSTRKLQVGITNPQEAYAMEKSPTSHAMKEISQQQPHLSLQHDADVIMSSDITTANSIDHSSETLPLAPPEDGAFKDLQSNQLSHKKLMIVFPFLALAQFTAYLDQTSISAAVPIIGDALDLGPQLSWVATSYLLATTAVQLLNGRLSDIFGRKQLLLASLAILGFGNLVSGFSNSPAMLFTFRAVAGLGGGAM